MRLMLGQVGGETGRFVLTHHARTDLVMGNGTTFHFIDARPEEVLARAAEAANGRDVVLGGGPSTVGELLGAGLVAVLHLVIAPVLLGSGERLVDGPGIAMPRHTPTSLVCEGGVAHAHLTRA